MNFENLIKNVSDNNESLTNTIKCSNLIICEFWENVKLGLIVGITHEVYLKSLEEILTACMACYRNFSRSVKAFLP